MHSGIATQSKEFVMGTLHKYDWGFKLFMTRMGPSLQIYPPVDSGTEEFN